MAVRHHWALEGVRRSSWGVRRLADGDLTVSLPAGRYDETGQDEIGQLFEGFNRVVENLRATIRQLDEAVRQAAGATGEISLASEQIAASTQEQSVQAHEVAAAVEQMVRTIVENARTATATAQAAEASGIVAREGGAVVEQTVVKIRAIAAVTGTATATVERLGQSSAAIGEIVQVIDEIADQTNLLALNAAIEAARAGDQGRGFAVLSDEVRKLAERTTQATKQIAGMIRSVQTETQAAVTAMQQGRAEVEAGILLADTAGDALRRIVTGTTETLDLVNQIAAAGEEQSATSEQIARSVETISSVSNEAAAGIAGIARSTEGLHVLTNALRTQVARFRLDAGTASGTAPAGRGDGAAHPRAIAPRATLRA